jgi:hypothetical protein
MATVTQRLIAFVIVVLVCGAGVAGYIQWRQPSRTAPAPVAGGATPFLDLKDPAVAARVAQLRAAPHVVYLSRRTDSFDQVGLAPLDHPDARVLLTTPACERSYFGSKTGLCLTINRESPSPRAYAIFVDHALQPTRQYPLDGLPIRARVSPDNRWAAATVFVSGESYSGDFTTRTTLFDLEKGTVIDSLESFTTERDGKPYQAVDFNFWGVTFFAAGDRFLATLGTGGKRLLVEGDITRRHMKVIANDVECPSLSPDGQKIVFKRSGAVKSEWRLWVKVLATGDEWPITAEDRYIDDQAEWLDNDRVLYGLLYGEGVPENSLSIWISHISRDSGFDASVFLRSASSPSVIR